MNGALVITTRKSQQPGLHVNYTVQTALESPARYQNLLSATEWRQYAPQLARGNQPFDGQRSTDWQRQISRSVINTDQLLTLSGALPKGDISLTIGYLNRLGVIRNTGLKRLTTRLDANYNWWHNRIKVQTSGWYTNSREQQMPADLANAVQTANPTIDPSIRSFSYPSGNVFQNPLNILDSVNHNTRAQYSGYRVALLFTPIPNLLVSLQRTLNYSKIDINTLDSRLEPITPFWFGNETEEMKQNRINLIARINAGENDYSSTLATNDLALQYKLTGKRSELTGWVQYTTNQIGGNYFTYRRTRGGYEAYYADGQSPTPFNGFGVGLDYSLRQRLFVNVAYRQENYVVSPIRARNQDPAIFPVLSLRWQVKPRFFVEYVWTKGEPLQASAIRLESGWPLNLTSSQFFNAQSPSQERFFQQVSRFSYRPAWGQVTAEYIMSDKYTAGMTNVAFSTGASLGVFSYTLRQQAVNLQVEGNVLSRSKISLNTGLVAGFLHTGMLTQDIGTRYISELYSPFRWYYGYMISDLGGGKFSRNGPDQPTIGQPYPKLTLGWTTLFSWNHLTASMLWRSTLGGSISAPKNVSNISLELSNGNWYRGIKIGQNDHLDNMVAFRKQQSDNETYVSYFSPNNLMMQSTNSLRLDNLAIGYRFRYATLPLQLQIFAQNLFTISSFPGVDPERSYYDLEYSSSSAFYYKPRIIGLKLAVDWNRPQ